MKYGLILEEPIVDKDYVFGAANEIGGDELVPSGDWSGWLPDIEVQNLNGVEPYACVSFATLNCVEILERQEYGATTSYSDRFLANVSGTAALKGNSPQKVAETLRKGGCVQEKDLPFDSTVTTFEKFYAPIAKYLYSTALVFIAEYDFGHEYVPTDAKSLMNALKYSPLVFTTYAWVQDENGLYYRPQGLQDNHATVCFDFKENEYWLIFDSYMDRDNTTASLGTTIKKIRWDTLPMQAKRFTLHRQIKNESAWSRFLKLFLSLFPKND